MICNCFTIIAMALHPTLAIGLLIVVAMIFLSNYWYLLNSQLTNNTFQNLCSSQQTETNIINTKSRKNIPDSWEDFDESTISSTISSNNKFENVKELHLFKSTLSLGASTTILGYQMEQLSRLHLYGVTFDIGCASKMMADVDEIGCRIFSALISPPAVRDSHSHTHTTSSSTTITEPRINFKKYFKNLSYLELNYCSWCTGKSLMFFAVTLLEERLQQYHEKILPNLRTIVIRGLAKKQQTSIFAKKSAFTGDLECGTLMSIFQSTCGIELSFHT